MATAEKTKEQQKQFQVPEYSDDEDYDSNDDYEYSDEEDEQPQPAAKNQQLQRRRQPLQQQQDDDDDEEYTDEEDYSDYYPDDEDYDQYGMTQRNDGNGMPWQNNSNDMNVVDKKQKSIDDEEGMKLKLELNLEIEIELKAHIHGDLTLALMSWSRRLLQCIKQSAFYISLYLSPRIFSVPFVPISLVDFLDILRCSHSQWAPMTRFSWSIPFSIYYPCSVSVHRALFDRRLIFPVLFGYLSGLPIWPISMVFWSLCWIAAQESILWILYY